MTTSIRSSGTLTIFVHQTLPCLQVSATELDDLFISDGIIAFPSDEIIAESSNWFHASCLLADYSCSIHQQRAGTVQM